jgi:hypothetical protein
LSRSYPKIFEIQADRQNPGGSGPVSAADESNARIILNLPTVSIPPIRIFQGIQLAPPFGAFEVES